VENPKRSDGWEKNLKLLSGWACVAFAARCAQRVLPLYADYEKTFNPRYSNTRIQQIQNAIAITLEAAETGGASTSLKNEEFSSSIAAIIDARNFIRPKPDTESASIQFYGHAAAHQAIQVAHAAVEAIKCVFSNSDKYSAHAAAAATFSQSASGAGEQAENRRKVSNTADKSFLTAAQIGDALMRDAMWQDYEILFRFFSKSQPDKNVRVEVAKLGMLWGKAMPHWLGRIQSIQEEDQFESNSTLEVFLEPGSASKETIQRVFEAISKLHIASGGRGLEFRADDEFVFARERVGA
jgi:hypothetical protein